MDFQGKTLCSGRVVHIRPLSWNEYWELSDKRLAVQASIMDMAGADKGNGLDAQRKAICDMRELRELPLRWCVQDFDAIAAECSVCDIVEMESAITAMSEKPVREGNCSPAAAPTATAAA